MDKKTNVNANGLLNLCKNFNLNIVNGRFGSDKGVGDYTCHKNGIAPSVLDYTIISDSLLPHIANFSVGTFDRALSDVHCPPFFELFSDEKTNCDNSCENSPGYIAK